MRLQHVMQLPSQPGPHKAISACKDEMFCQDGELILI